MIDLEQFTAHLSRLESEMIRRPALRCFLDANLEHNLCALRIMGVLPKETAPVEGPASELVSRKQNRHGGSRYGAGRKRIHASKAARERAYRRRVREWTKSSS